MLLCFDNSKTFNVEGSAQWRLAEFLRSHFIQCIGLPKNVTRDDIELAMNADLPLSERFRCVLQVARGLDDKKVFETPVAPSSFDSHPELWQKYEEVRPVRSSCKIVPVQSLLFAKANENWY